MGSPRGVNEYINTNDNYSYLQYSFLFGKLGPKLRGWLLKGAAIFVIALGISTLWQGLAYYAIMRNLLG